ncbi:MAG: RHS repeat-associated core domain-containing protein [Caldilinea sp. CFX5]|nr:RHS repeat-associated core domain-containing protein [Caldilinea sp. CFX5]
MYHTSNRQVLIKADGCHAQRAGQKSVAPQICCCIFSAPLTPSIINGATKTGETRYFPWGKDRFASGQTLTSYKFTGQREEAGLGLYYYGARWYDPALGRFIGCLLGADTIVPNLGDAQSFDRYAYGYMDIATLAGSSQKR